MALRKLFIGLALFGAAASAAAAAVREPDPTFGVTAEDAEMEAAKTRARSELSAFYERLAAPAADEREFMVKYDIVPGELAEFVWAGSLARSAGVTTGTLLNQPEQGGANAGDPVAIADADIVDWTYRKGTSMQGGYTNRVLLGRMPEREAAAYRAYLGW